MHARHERAIGAEHVVYRASHARHHAHAHRDVRAVGEFDADVRDRAAERAHGEGHHVERTPAHATFEEFVERLAHRRGGAPVVGRPRVVLALAAYERAVLDARDVGRIGARQIAVRTLRRIELLQHSAGDHLGAKPVVLGLRAVAPDDAFGLGYRGDVVHPGAQTVVTNVARRIDGCGECGHEIGMVHRRRRAARENAHACMAALGL